tara:strand:+ start:276 stop:629 length:354 start_codon:yes stop_codon:yes gene_type:complete
LNTNKPYSRVERVEKQVLDILSNILLKDINLSKLGFITFTEVKMAKDLKSAKVFYSVLNQNISDDQLNIEMNKRQKAFKKYMSPQLHLKSTPSIRFFHDEKYTYGEKIDRLFKEKNL